ncbi:MAG TPA: hypothetical protein PK510_16835, partial [Ottowia sp.]|nr:hypothetical protein [Ottowia sp.]
MTLNFPRFRGAYRRRHVLAACALALAAAGAAAQPAASPAAPAAPASAAFSPASGNRVCNSVCGVVGCLSVVVPASADLGFQRPGFGKAVFEGEYR